MPDAATQQLIDSLWNEIATIKAAHSNMIRPGVIVSFNAANNTAKIDLGIDQGTHDIPNGGNQAHSTGQHWHGIKPGMQVTVFAPEGDLTNAFFTPGGYLANIPQPSTRPDEDVISRTGGSEVRLREGGYAQIAATSIDKLKFKIGGTTYQLAPSALVTSSPLET